MSKIKYAETIVYNAVIGGELEIDEQGRIWRVAHRTGNRWTGGTNLIKCERRRAEHPLPSGYLQIRAMYNWKRTNALAHRLVYHHFFGPIPPELTINHENGVKADNRPENLKPASDSEQIQHMLKVLRKGRVLNQWGEKNHAAKLTDAQVAGIRKRRASGEKLLEIAQDYGVAFQTVSKIALGSRRQRSGR